MTVNDAMKSILLNMSIRHCDEKATLEIIAKVVSFISDPPFQQFPQHTIMLITMLSLFLSLSAVLTKPTKMYVCTLQS